MPKTGAEIQVLRSAVLDAISAGSMAAMWPLDTLWLGGAWRSDRRRWEWDDGTPIDHIAWAAGQPSSADMQEQEPWLCMVHTGQVHDSDRPYSFAVMCETSTGDVETATADDEGGQMQTPSGRAARYRFAGVAAGPEDARRKCGISHLAMPKTPAQQDALATFVNQLVANGHMSAGWPNNTIWVGGYWSPKTKAWVWDDGDPVAKVNWAPGQPSSWSQQIREPWLCMLTDGYYYDSASGIPYYSFGAVCEEGDLVHVIAEKTLVHRLVEAVGSVRLSIAQGLSFAAMAMTFAGVLWFLVVRRWSSTAPSRLRQLAHDSVDEAAMSSDSDGLSPSDASSLEVRRGHRQSLSRVLRGMHGL